MIFSLWKGTIYGERARCEYAIGEGVHETAVGSVSGTVEMLRSEMVCFLTSSLIWKKRIDELRTEQKAGEKIHVV